MTTRKAARIINAIKCSTVTTPEEHEALTIAERVLWEAEPVKHGRWIKNDNGTYSCSECQSWIPNEQHYYARYCLHCGVKMNNTPTGKVDTSTEYANTSTDEVEE